MLDDFYEVFAQNMRDLGTPVYAKRFFDLSSSQSGLTRGFPQYMYGKCVAAGFLLKHRDRMEVSGIQDLRKYNSISVNMLLY